MRIETASISHHNRPLYSSSPVSHSLFRRRLIRFWRTSSTFNILRSTFLIPHPSSLLVLLFLATLILPSMAQAASVYWDGVNGSWNVAGNWSTSSSATTPNPAAVPGSSDDAIFNITTVNTNETVTLGTNQSAKSLTFNNTGTTTLAAGGTARTLTLGTYGGSITIAAAAGAITLGDSTAGNNVLIALVGDQSWVNNSANNFTINNTVGTFTRSPWATINFNKVGAGVFSMSTTVLPSVNNIVGPWASFNTGSSTTYAKNPSGTIAGLGYTGGADGTAVTTIANLNDATETINYSVNVTGASVNNPAVTANTIRFTGTANGTYLGGAFQVNGLMNTGSKTWQINSKITIGSTKELDINAATLSGTEYDIYINNQVLDNSGGASTVVKNGPGCLLFNSGTTSTFSGGLIINAGTVRQGSAANNLGTGTITINGGAIGTTGTTTATRGISNTFIINGSCQIADITYMGAVTGNWQLGSVTVNGSPTITLGMTTTGSHSIILNGGTFNGTATFSGISYLTQSAAFTGGGGLALGSGYTGTMTLSQANTYSGNTTINGGTLKLTGTINNSPSIAIGVGGIFDVSSYATYTWSGSTSLSASGTGSTPATIKGGTTVDLGTQPITLTYDGANPALYISQGALSLGGNVFTINGTRLVEGTGYVIVEQQTGSIISTGSNTVKSASTAIPPGASGTIRVVGNQVLLDVSSGGTTLIIR